jgi:hypothetical protein
MLFARRQCHLSARAGSELLFPLSQLARVLPPPPITRVRARPEAVYPNANLRRGEL